VVQPGGVRVAPLEEASLDVIGHMLSLEQIPREDLADQILQVLSALVTLAAEATIERASDDEIDHIRRLVARLAEAAERRDEDLVARMELMAAFMEISGNLVTRLIARGLLMQFVPRVQEVADHQPFDDPVEHLAQLEKLDAALAARDRFALRSAMESLGNLTRQSVGRVLHDARNAHTERMAEI